MRKLTEAVVGLRATTVVMSGGTVAWAAPCTGSCIEKTVAGGLGPAGVARQMPWEASGLPVSPDGGYQPDGGYHND